MALDDADSIRLFVSRMNSTNLTSPTTTAAITPAFHNQVANGHVNTDDAVIDATENISENQYNQSERAKTPPPSNLAVQNHLTSPKPHPKPSPHISGLNPPNNTPKTAASSPRLTAANTHNEDVAEAFSDYVNNMEGRPLSESMWAPGSARHKPSVLSGNRSAKVLTPIKAVEHNPSINDTFDRMSFKVADPNHKVDENLIGDRVTQSLFSKAPPLFVNKFSVLGDTANDVQAKPEAASDEDLEPSAHTDTTKKVQSEIEGASNENIEIAGPTDTVKELPAKADSASGEDLPNIAQIDQIKKGSDVPSASKTYVPPHLRSSCQNPDAGTQAAAPELKQVVDKTFPVAIESSPPKSSQTPSSSDRNSASSEFTVKTETTSPYTEGICPDVASTTAGPVENANSAFIAMLTARLQECGPLSPEHLLVLRSFEDQLRVSASHAHDKDIQAVTGVEPEPERRFFESNPVQLARQMSYDLKKRAPSTLPRVSETEIRVATNGAAPKLTAGPAGGKPLKGDASESEDREHKNFFNTWPKLEERGKPAAKVRKVIIKDLPRDSTHNFVASVVYGGPIEEIYIRSSAAGDLSAVIRFMDAGDCMKFYDQTSNGLVYKKDAKGRELVLFVELSKDVDVVGGLLQGWIDSGVTRCVRAVGVEAKWDMKGLLKVAERKHRKVEKIVDGQNAGGSRSVVFRFCKVEDAVQFKAALCRDEEWEHCNIHHAADPCAAATGVHFED